jgi:LPXTG-motif cell wall-anchored protein
MLFFVIAAGMAVIGGAWVTVRRKRKAAERTS